MKILIPDWKSFGKEDIQETLEGMGHEIVYYRDEPRSYRRDPRFRSQLRAFVRGEGVECVFSSNYFPILSVVCQELKIPYISWCYDSPLVLTYSDTVFNACNYLFLFDSQMVQDLQRLGVEHVWYLPMAVNAGRLAKLYATPQQQSIVRADVSFVGTLYTEEHNLYDRMTTLDAWTRGYLEGIMKAQRMVYGCYFLEDLLTEDVIRRMQAAQPLEVNRDGHETLAYLYANYNLCRKMTQRDRLEILEQLDARREYTSKLYTKAPTPQFTHLKNMGDVQYLNEMPIVFQNSKINLNISLRSIQRGIPLRAMDIMGAGGFLLTNYQSDFERHFTEGEDYVCYESIPDLMKKIDYYLANEKEREAIASRGQKKVFAEHTYADRFRQIWDTVF